MAFEGDIYLNPSVPLLCQPKFSDLNRPSRICAFSHSLIAMFLSSVVSVLACQALLVAANPAPPQVTARAVLNHRIAQRAGGLLARDYTTCFDDEAVAS